MTPGGGALFGIAKRKRETREQGEPFSKQKLLKVCYQGQNVTVLAILESLEFKNFQCSMAPPL